MSASVYASGSSDVRLVGALSDEITDSVVSIDHAGRVAMENAAARESTLSAAQMHEAAEDGRCLMHLEGIPAHVDDDLFALSLVVGAAGLMQSKFDRNVLRDEGKIALQQIDMQISAAIAVLGHVKAGCPTSVIASMKVDDLQTVLEDVKAKLLPLRAKFGLPTR